MELPLRGGRSFCRERTHDSRRMDWDGSLGRASQVSGVGSLATESRKVSSARIGRLPASASPTSGRRRESPSCIGSRSASRTVGRPSRWPAPRFRSSRAHRSTLTTSQARAVDAGDPHLPSWNTSSPVQRCTGGGPSDAGGSLTKSALATNGPRLCAWREDRGR